MAQPKFYCILGGQRPGIFHSRPFIPNGSMEPAFPVVIMCYTTDEARAVYELQPLIAAIDMSQSTLDIARLLASSSQVRQTLRDVDKFYPVAYGINNSAVHRDWGYLKPLVVGSNVKFRKLSSFCESIIFMIAKGSDEIMQQVFPSDVTWKGSSEQHAELPKTPRRKADPPSTSFLFHRILLLRLIESICLGQATPSSFKAVRVLSAHEAEVLNKGLKSEFTSPP